MTGLTEEQWAHPSRCEGWSAKDVAIHLASTNFFWEMSIRSGMEGTPTEILAAFDPVATPAQMVAQSDQPIAEIIDGFAQSTRSLASCVEDLAPSGWQTSAESPPGHVTISAVAHHALWDAWIHERDILLPLDIDPPAEPDEVLASLRYVAGLAPALALNNGASDTGTFNVSVTDPDADFRVVVGTEVAVIDGPATGEFQLGGRAVDVLEALSFRTPPPTDIPPSLHWAFNGLGRVFDH